MSSAVKITITADGSGLKIVTDDGKAQLLNLGKAGKDAGDQAAAGIDTVCQKLDQMRSAALVGAQAMVAAFTVDKVVSMVKEMATLNARYQELGAVMPVVGRNAGYTATEMNAAAASMQKAGISMLESRNTAIQLAQAQISLGDASKLARIAQDAAVVGNMNSSEALNHMIYGIKSGQIEVLRTIGINVNFEQSYKAMAQQLHVSTEALTEHQKMQARENAVLEEGTKLTGAYEAAMGTAGKQMRSMARYTEDLKVMRGEVFNEALTVGVMAFVDQLKDANGEMVRLSENQALAQWGADVADTTAFAADAVMKVVGTFKAVGDAIGWAAAQLALLRMPTNTKEEMQAYWAARDAINEESRARQASYDKLDTMFQDALEKRRAAQRADNQARIDLEQEYARRSLAVAQAYANATVDIQRKAQLDLAKSMYAAEFPDKPKDKPAIDTHKGLTEYERLIKSINEKTAADKLDMETQGSLTAGQRVAIKVMEDLRDGTLKLTAGQKQKVTAALEDMLATERSKLADEAATKQMVADVAARAAARNKEYDGINAYMLAQEEADNKAVQGSRDALKAAQALYDQYGLTKSQVAELTLLELRRQQSFVREDSERYKTLQEQIDLQEKLIGVMKKTEGLDEQKTMWSSIEQTAHSTFTNIFQGGQDLWTKLRSTAQSIFVDWLYQVTAKKWIFNIIESVSGGAVANAVMPGMASSAGGLNALGSLGSIGSTIASFGGTMATGFMNTLAGGGLTSTFQAAGAMMANGFTSQGLGMAAGGLGVVGLGIGALSMIKSAMDYKITPNGGAIVANVNSGGASAVANRTDFIQEGGLFGGGTTHNSSWANADAGTTGYIDTSIKAVTAANRDYAKALGLNADALDGFSKQITINTTGMDAAAAKAAIDAELAKFAGEQVNVAFGDSISKLSLAGENSSQTLARVATELVTVNSTFGAMGATLYDVSAAGAAAADGLVQAMGGLQNFQAQTASYIQNFFSADEQRNMTVASITKTLNAAGLNYTADQVGSASRADFRAAVSQIDTSTAAGQKQYAAAMAVEASFASITQSTDQVAQSNLAAAAAAKQAATAIGGGSSGGGGGGSSLVSALQSLVDAVLEEANRILGVVNASSGASGLAATQAQFAIATAQARAGDQNALKSLPQLSQSIETLAAANVTSLQELQMIRLQTAGSLRATGALVAAQYGLSVPSFDVGTNRVPVDMLAMVHAGEAIVPAAYNPANGAYSSQGNDGDVVAAIGNLRRDVAGLTSEMTTVRKTLVNATNGGNYFVVVQGVNAAGTAVTALVA